jgi:hypothetical protein
MNGMLAPGLLASLKALALVKVRASLRVRNDLCSCDHGELAQREAKVEMLLNLLLALVSMATESLPIWLIFTIRYLPVSALDSTG